MARKIVLTGVVVTTAALVVATAPVASASTSTARNREAALVAAQQHRLEAGGVRAMMTTSSGGVYVSVPSSVSSFNKARVKVRPKVHVGHGTTKRVTSYRLSVYSGKHRVAYGSSVRLRIGHYSERVTVRYRGWRYVTRHKNVSTKHLHPGDYPANTVCTVGSVSSAAGNGVNDTIGNASCTSASYPGQTKDVTGSALYDVEQGDGVTSYTVGQKVSTGEVYFSAYYTTSTKSVAYKVKLSTGSHSFTTSKRRLTVKDAGYVKFFAGGDTSGGKVRFKTSAPSKWGYAISCGDYGYFGVNWFTASSYGQFGPGYADPGQTIRFVKAKFHGSVELHVFASDCVWTIGIFSKARVR